MQPNGHHAASPFMNPSALPGAAPQPSSDGEFPNQWNLALPSRTATPALSTGRSTPQDDLVQISREQLDRLLLYVVNSQTRTPSDAGSASSSPSFSNVAPFSPAETQLSLSRPGTPDAPKRKRIPRPPNAFMLYRSHLLKTRQIPPNIEHRQQNISRVAGESWNMLEDDEKKKWHDKAKEVLTAHMAKHPDYKFSPERKTSRRKTAQDPEAPAVDGEDYIRFLREKYLGLSGPAPKPTRNRKPKSRRGVEEQEFTPHSLPGSLRSSPTTTLAAPHNVSAPPSVSGSPAILPSDAKIDLPYYWQPGPLPPFPDVPPPQEVLDQFALQHGQPGPFDDDVTPKASTFGEIPMPNQAKFNFAASLNYPMGNAGESHLGLHNLALPGSFTGEPAPVPSRAETPSQEQSSAGTDYNSMWASLVQDPFNQNGTDASGSGLFDDGSSPYATGEPSGPIDFDNIHFPSLFPGSD